MTNATDAYQAAPSVVKEPMTENDRQVLRDAYDPPVARNPRTGADALQSLDDIQTKVGVWSLRNFGGQESRVLTYYGYGYQPLGAPPDKARIYNVPLGSLASLLGIGEEICELMLSKTHADRFDAVGDILVYTCDYCQRERVRLSECLRWYDWPDENVLARIHEAYGKLLHATLKRHQGIRGFDSLPQYQRSRDQALGWLVHALAAYCDDFLAEGEDYLHVLRTVWGKVEQRDWKANPQNAADMPPTALPETD